MSRHMSLFFVMSQFDKEASPTRDRRAAKNAAPRAARSGPSPRKKRLLRMTIKLTHHLTLNSFSSFKFFMPSYSARSASTGCNNAALRAG